MILESMGDGVAVADAHGKFVLFNRSAEQLLGVGQLMADPQQWPDHFGLFSSGSKKPRFQRMKCHLPVLFEVKVLTPWRFLFVHEKRPEGVPICVSGRPLRDPNGTLSGGVCGVP